ncbi:hypothetical protein [Oryzibacter oryziterrae]|uniref:hypothetical protein n=1 Tax=Oryzibacter oryziterrae TaxID=2766474 RepID=UPI001F31945F|nr:hypothetical protein [Oryzibacter oryziterrae]
MLAEALQFAATLALSPRTRPSVISDSVGLWARAGRCRKAWTLHEENCKAAVNHAIDGVQHRGTAVILGSGLLRDVPIERLFSMFREVVLIDICHLASVRAWAKLRRYSNLTFRTADLSGYDKLLQQTRISLATGEEDLGVKLDPLGFLRRIDDLSLVVSANILSQIAVGAAARLQRPDGHARIMPDDTLRLLVAAHLDSLAALPCKTCLLTDVSFRREDRTGNVTETVDLLHGVEPPEGDSSWDWPVAPFGEESADIQRIHHCIATEDVAVPLG